jgi:hypothetical protein
LGNNERPSKNRKTVVSPAPGGVAEWSKAAVLKTAVGVTLPKVRILSPPPIPSEYRGVQASE